MTLLLLYRAHSRSTPQWEAVFAQYCLARHCLLCVLRAPVYVSCGAVPGVIMCLAHSETLAITTVTADQLVVGHKVTGQPAPQRRKAPWLKERPLALELTTQV